MILEALNFATTYLISPRKDAGEINSSVTLWARARRCASAWAEHEAHSKTVVQKAMETVRERRVAVVLGSGLLRDTPIEALSEAFDEVRLYDLQHLASVRAWARLKGLRNLTFLHRDLSGLDGLTSGFDMPDPLAFLREIAGLDLVISANLLSQIGVGVARLVKAHPELPRDTVPRVIEAHIRGLSSLACASCLITDMSYEVLDKSGEILEGDDLMHGVTLPESTAEWSWPVAPFGELDPTYRAVHRVAAITRPLSVGLSDA